MADQKRIEGKLDRITELLQHLLALELFRGGVARAEIGRHLKVAKSSVVKMLRDFDKESEK